MFNGNPYIFASHTNHMTKTLSNIKTTNGNDFYYITHCGHGTNFVVYTKNIYGLIANKIKLGSGHIDVFMAQTVKQSKLTFKHTGGNQHNREAESVALGIVKELQGSPKFNAGHAMIITQKRMKFYLDHLAGEIDDTEDDEV